MRSMILVLSVSLVLVACGKENATTEKLKYSFSYNGCETGEHEFESKEAYCAGLKDEAGNNYCAYSMRKQRFQEMSCEGGW